MRNLTINETNLLSGGYYCVDEHHLNKIQSKAWQDGLIFGGIATAIIGAISYGVTDSVVSTAGVSLITLPYLIGYGYFNSSAWNVFI